MRFLDVCAQLHGLGSSQSVIGKKHQSGMCVLDTKRSGMQVPDYGDINPLLNCVLPGKRRHMATLLQHHERLQAEEERETFIPHH